MGEYARINGQSIKIGTCENMYYLRAEDVHKVQQEPYSLDAATCPGLRFRLPFPDEDDVQIGHYKEFERGLRLYRTVKIGKTNQSYTEDFTHPYLETASPGRIQMHHQASGLLLSVDCHHGLKLPDVGNASVHWNGKGHSLELVQVKRIEGGKFAPVVGCRHCGDKYVFSWEEVLPFVADPVMRERLEKHI